MTCAVISFKPWGGNPMFLRGSFEVNPVPRDYTRDFGEQPLLRSQEHSSPPVEPSSRAQVGGSLPYESLRAVSLSKRWVERRLRTGCCVVRGKPGWTGRRIKSKKSLYGVGKM